MSSDPIATSPTATGATGPGGVAADSPDLKRLATLATEFESMLLTQMLREMRQAGSWKEESEESGFGNQALFDAIDVELALRLSRAQSLGLRDQLLRQVTHGEVNSAAELTAPPVPDGHLAMPPSITSGFGWRQDPLTGAAAFHRGIDVRAAFGEKVAAIGRGTVVAAGAEGGYGNTIVIDHGGGLRTRYAHLSSLSVAAGDTVAAGAEVGRAGRTGRATGTHVHFEALLHGQPLDPGDLPGRLKSMGLDADVEASRSESWRKR
jgi:murein DD-endopeptidase MepM/ murein hydrolase activator NlpD